jgi:hypothetical protein
MNGIELRNEQRMALIGKVYNDPASSKNYLDGMAEVLAY